MEQQSSYSGHSGTSYQICLNHSAQDLQPSHSKFPTVSSNRKFNAARKHFQELGEWPCMLLRRLWWMMDDFLPSPSAPTPSRVAAIPRAFIFFGLATQSTQMELRSCGHLHFIQSINGGLVTKVLNITRGRPKLSYKDVKDIYDGLSFNHYDAKVERSCIDALVEVTGKTE
ncbi:hypothetical protein PIB30_041571 [Stylosanthes scabra]|uniref:Uncharacterized protein n=1 Tax=Stylosanthes scabra TaxID=79078 RepID=A0ABU6RF18_9FABA|nr:hypothetical protein [Stylosanthes scabra]